MTNLLRTLLVAGSAALCALPAGAQTYPGKPIRVIVSTSPGGITDIAVRILGAHITARTGQPVVIDNRPGASGNIAMEAVAHAAPDGYTLGFANTGNITINPFLFAHMPFDPLIDLVPVGPVGTVPLFLVINGKVPARTLAEFIAYAKANPDTVNYAGAGAGTTPDLAGREFMPARRAQARDGSVQGHLARHHGGGGGRRAGHLHLHGAAHGLRALRRPAGAGRRHPQARTLYAGHAHVRGAGVSGLRDLDLVLAVRAARHPGRDRGSAQPYTRSVHEDAESQQRLDANFVDPLIMTAAEFAAQVKADAVKWERIVRETGAKLE